MGVGDSGSNTFPNPNKSLCQTLPNLGLQPWFTNHTYLLTIAELLLSWFWVTGLPHASYHFQVVLGGAPGGPTSLGSDMRTSLMYLHYFLINPIPRYSTCTLEGGTLASFLNDAGHARDGTWWHPEVVWTSSIQAGFWAWVSVWGSHGL